MLALKDTAWSWLADVTDRTQVEWQELADELEHKGSTGRGLGGTRGAGVRSLRVAPYRAAPGAAWHLPRVRGR